MKMNFVAKLTAVLLAVCALYSARAAKTTVDGITWTYTVTNGCAMLGDGKSSAISTNTIGSITIPSRIGRYDVTSIGKRAFFGCSLLESVIIPNSVTSIVVQAFYGCSGLTSVTIPDSVTSIGNGAFMYCSGLTSVTIPDSVTSIEYYTFSQCSGLTSVTIPDSVTSIGTHAFEGCSGLTSVTIGNSVTSIGDYAFRQCSGLTSVTIPDSVTSIVNSAFEGCSELTSVTIGNSVTRIGDGAFRECSGLTSVTIPDSVTSIGNDAFRKCISLENITFLGNAPVTASRTFSSVAADCTAYVTRDSTGWGVEIPGTWNGINIAYIDDMMPTTYTVTFDLGAYGTRTGGGELIQSVVDGECAVAPTVEPVRGWKFAGWNRDFSDVSSNLTISAVYEELKTTSGIPYSWFKENGLFADGEDIDLDSLETLDSDNDGYKNGTEYWCKTDPMNEYSHFEISGVHSNGVTYVTMGPCIKGESYNLFFSDLHPDDWDKPNDGDGLESNHIVGYMPVEAESDGLITVENFDADFILRFYSVDHTQWLNETPWVEIKSTVPQAYTVIFDLGAHGTHAGGGELTQRVVEGECADVPTVQAMLGWRFAGWMPDVSSPILSNTTFVAQYEEDVTTYHLEIVQPARGGSITGATSGLQPVDAMLMLTRKADTGYHIVGWTGDIDGLYQWGDSLAVVMDMPRTIGLAVALDAYSITYADTRGAANGNPATYTIEDEVVFAPLPDVTGWKFMGWSPVSIPVGSMGAVTVTAQWVPAECSVTIGGEETKVTWGSEITFRAPDPFVDELCKTQLVYVGTSFTAPVVTNEFTVIVTNDIDFTWDILATNYWFEAAQSQNGTIVAPANGWKPYGETFLISAMPTNHYHFVKWTGDTEGCVATNGNGLVVTMEQARSIGVEFAIDTFTVLFKDGAHGKLSGKTSQSVPYGGKAEVPAVNPHVGYKFVGWNGDVTVPVTRNLTFEARYATIPYSINYTELKGAANPNPETYTIVDEVVFAPLPDVEGWSFVGWSPASIAKGSTGAKTVTAQWDRVVHSVNVGGVSTNVIYGSQMTFRAPESWVDELCKTQLVYVGTSFTAPVVTNEFTVVVTNDIDFTWDILATNYWLNVEDAELGVIDGAGDGWQKAESVVALTAVADAGCRHYRWLGDIDGCVADSNILYVKMDRTRTVGARFAYDVRPVIDSISPEYPTEESYLILQGHGEGGSVVEHLWTAVRLSDGTVSELARTANCSVKLNAGEWRIEYRVKDTTGIWSEPASQTITVSAVMPVVDLQVARTGVKFYDSIGLPTSNVKTGDVVTVKVTVQNRGNANMSGRATLYLCDGILPVDDMSALTEDDPRVLATARVSRLNLGKSQTVSMTWNVGSSLSGEERFYDEGPNAFTVVVVSDADTETVVNNNLVTTMLELGESDIELSEIFNLSADYETSIFVGADYSVSGRVWYERDGARVYVAGAALTFMIDGEIAGSGVTDSSGRYLWMFTAPDKGSHTISVKAVDGTVVKTYAGTFTSVERAEPGADDQPGSGGGSGGEEENPEEPVPSVKKANLKVQTFACEGDGITGMNGNAYSAALGGEVTLDAVVKNVGQMAVTNAFTVKITDITNGDVLGFLVVTNGLAVGEELNVSIDEPFVLDKSGRYGYRIIVDEAGLVDESSETDNEGKVWIAVEEPLPNLVVTDMTFSDSQPVAGDELVIRAKVRNIGDATCPAGVKVVFNMGNSISEIELSDELSVDASADVAYSIIPAEGTLKISIEADYFDEIAESNETDNRISRTIAIYSVNADVKPVSIGAEPYPKAGEPCVLTAVFRNDGGASYQGGTAVFFVDNPDTGKIAEVTVGPIAWKGGVGTATCVWTPDINIDRVVGVILGEKVYKTTFSATPPPDLRVVTEDISFEPGTPSSGDKVKFRAMIRNASGSVASTNATVVFDVAPVDGDFAHLTTMTVSYLAPGGSVAVDADIPYTVLHGIYKVKVSVMDESGRDVRSSDNIAERIFGVDVPVAVTGGDIVCVAGDTVTLDGSESIDATQWRWSLIEAPNGNTASISDASVAVTTFTPQIAGLYKFSLVVSDGLNESTPAECTVLVDRVRITASATKGGSISPSGEIVYPAGATPEYVGIEARGYSFDSFKLDGVSVTNKLSTYKFSALDRNHTIEACFSAVDYSITYNELKGAVNTNPATYTIEDEVVFAPLSNVEGWNFVGWSPKSIAKGSTGPIIVTAQWERVIHSVNVGGVSTNVVYGSEMTFRAPEPWYDETCTTQIVYVGTTFTAPVVTNEFTVIVTNDIDFTWDILATNYWLKVSASEGGSVDFDGAWMSAGSRKSISATPDFSYRFVRWEGDVSDSQSTSPDIVILMNQARSLKAVFEKIPLTIGEAANAPEYDWYTEGDAMWFGEWSKAASDGVHAVRSGAIGDSKETVLGLRLDGAGTLSFDWRASCEERYDAVRLEVDGKQIRVLWGETSWTNVCINLDIGEHNIRWVYMKGRSGALGEDAVWVDNVVWESATEPTLAEALGEFEWETEGDINWVGMRSEYAYEGTSFAIAEGLGDFEASIIRTRVSGAGTIKFRWAVSCEEFYDWFDFVVDGEVVEMTTGETDWMEVSVELGEGDHVLEWMYWKDAMDDLDLVGANCAMLDYVRWYPLDETPPEISDKTLAAFFAWLKANNQISQNATKEDAIRVFSSGMTAVGKSATLYSEFVAGTNPADVTSEFKAMIEIDENDQPIVTPSPNLGSSRKYVVFGKKNLEDSTEDWKEVEKGKEKDYNFFKINVDLSE